MSSRSRGPAGVNDKRIDEKGQQDRFTSQILPPYMRRSRKIAKVLAVLYLRGLSTGDFTEALPRLFGEEAAGLSATTIARPTAQWEQDMRAFRERNLAEQEYVYVWADGVCQRTCKNPHFRTLNFAPPSDNPGGASMEDLVQSPPHSADEGEMIGFDVWTEVHARARRGEARRKIARDLGLDRNTVRRILRQERPQSYQRTRTRPSILEPYRDVMA